MVVQDDGDHVCFLFVSSIRSGMSRLDMPHWIMMSLFARDLEAIASGFPKMRRTWPNSSMSMTRCMRGAAYRLPDNKE
jgi:hypothetical protein